MKVVDHAVVTPVRFALLSSALIMPACFSLPKTDVSTHVIDDFAEDAGGGLIPTWGAFTSWTCDAFTIRDENGDASADGGAVLDAGQPAGLDGGPPVACTLGPGDLKPHGLAATFDLAASTSNLGVAVATHTMDSTVDFTGFKTFQFHARLYSTTKPVAVLPMGTQLEVELGCKTNTTDAVAVQIANITVGAPTWNVIPLQLSDFQVTPLSQSRTACLGAVDSIRFVVLLPSGADAIAGTLQLDDIELTSN